MTRMGRILPDFCSLQGAFALEYPQRYFKQKQRRRGRKDGERRPVSGRIGSAEGCGGESKLPRVLVLLRQKNTFSVLDKRQATD